MRAQANAPAYRPAPLRAVARPQQRRAVTDSRALVLSILSGLLLACYVHDPAGAQAQLNQTRATVNHLATAFSPTAFQAALAGLTK